MHALRSLSITVPKGHQIKAHTHAWGQLIFPVDGAIDAFVADKAWLIPPARAVYVPPLLAHSLYFRRRTKLRTVYIPTDQCNRPGPACVGIFVSNLLKELVLETCRIGVLDGSRESHMLTGRLLVEQLSHAAPLRFALTLPHDRRALNAALAMWSEPGAHWDLEQLAAAAGASGRTLQRHFLSETGLRLGQWLQRARVFSASNSLLDGASVTDAGLLAGYASTSAFIATFKKEVGLTPLQYKRLAVGASEQSQPAVL